MPPDIGAIRSAVLAIPIVDMPVSFLLQASSLPYVRNVGSVVGIGACFFLLFIVGATATLDRRVVLAAAVGTILGIVLQPRAGIEAGGSVMVVFSTSNESHERMVETVFAYSGALDKPRRTITSGIAGARLDADPRPM